MFYEAIQVPEVQEDYQSGQGFLRELRRSAHHYLRRMREALAILPRVPVLPVLRRCGRGNIVEGRITTVVTRLSRVCQNSE